MCKINVSNGPILTTSYKSASLKLLDLKICLLSTTQGKNPWEVVEGGNRWGKQHVDELYF